MGEPSGLRNHEIGWLMMVEIEDFVARWWEDNGLYRSVECGSNADVTVSKCSVPVKWWFKMIQSGDVMVHSGGITVTTRTQCMENLQQQWGCDLPKWRQHQQQNQLFMTWHQPIISGTMSLDFAHPKSLLLDVRRSWRMGIAPIQTSPGIQGLRHGVNCMLSFVL